jgi:hypothetical protein
MVYIVTTVSYELNCACHLHFRSPYYYVIIDVRELKCKNVCCLQSNVNRKLIAGIKMTAFWDTAPCSQELHRRFRDARCLHHQDNHGGNTYLWNNGIYLNQTIRRCIPHVSLISGVWTQHGVIVLARVLFCLRLQYSEGRILTMNCLLSTVELSV